MKKDIWSVITAILCVALLFVVIAQGKRLDELSQQIDNKANYLHYELQGEISNITNIVRSELEELDRIVLSSELMPMGIDKNNKKLLANAVVNLKEWHEDTEVTLYITIGSEKFPIAMASDRNGGFSATVALPSDVEAKNIIELEALVSGGDMTRKESLGAWGDISMLLPLRSDGGGWSGPTYKNGVMSSQFNISMAGQNHTAAVVNNPEFWIYKNGEFVQKYEAVQTTYYSSDGRNYTIDTDNNLWSIDCKVGDNINIRFRCEDEYGLGYDFLFANWVALEETEDNAQSAGASHGVSKSLNLYWPE